MQTTSLSRLTQSLLSDNNRGWLPIDTDYLFYLQTYNSQRIAELTKIGVEANLKLVKIARGIDTKLSHVLRV